MASQASELGPEKEEGEDLQSSLPPLLADPLMLDNIKAMVETMVFYYTLQAKRQLKWWIKKSLPSTMKAKVQASCAKQMVLPFFDSIC
jgi:hypothetical protein